VLDAASVALVEEQVAKLRELAPALSIDSVEQQGVDVYVTFRRRRDGRNYVLRFRCDGYPVQPPSVLFVDPVSRENSGLDIWPNDGEQAIKRSWPTPSSVCPAFVIPPKPWACAADRASAGASGHPAAHSAVPRVAGMSVPNREAVRYKVPESVVARTQELLRERGQRGQEGYVVWVGELLPGSAIVQDVWPVSASSTAAHARVSLKDVLALDNQLQVRGWYILLSYTAILDERFTAASTTSIPLATSVDSFRSWSLTLVPACLESAGRSMSMLAAGAGEISQVEK